MDSDQLNTIVDSMKFIDYQYNSRFRHTLNHEIASYADYQNLYVKKDGLWQMQAEAPLLAEVAIPKSFQQTNFRVHSDEERVVDIEMDGIPWFGFAKGAFYVSMGDPYDRDPSKGGSTFYNRKEFLLK